MRDLIAYCGLDCETCEARIATLNDNRTLREKVAKEWSELNGVEITPEMINCLGCRVEGVKTPYCESICPIRQCALEKGVETCMDCAEIKTCEKAAPIRESDAAKCRIILLNGASSSGKSTIARELKNALEGVDAKIISIDDYLKMSADEPIWEDDVFEIMPRMCSDLTNALHDGKTVIIDHVITSERIYNALLRAAAGYRMKTVLVTCSADVLRERERERGNRCAGSAENSQKYLYPRDGYDMCVDSGEESIDEIVNAITGGIV